MEKLLDAFGFNVSVLIAQVINFVVLLIILYKIGYKPILKFVRERTATIEKGVTDAEKAAAALSAATARGQEIEADARRKAQDIIDEARGNAKKQADELTAKHRAELNKMTEKAQVAIAAEKEKIMAETREKTVGLVLGATEKLLHKKMDDKKSDQEFVKEVLDKVKK